MLVLTALVVALCSIIYWICTYTFGHWKKKGIPHPEPIPFFGNIFKAVSMKVQLGEFYHDLYKQYEGYRYFGIYRLRKPALIIRDPELVKNILIKDFNNFHDNDFDVSGSGDDILRKNPFFLTGHMWKVVRTQLTPSFTSGKIKSIFPLLQSVGKDMTDYLDKETGKGKPVDAKEITSNFTTDCVATCAYGLEAHSFTDPNSQFRDYGRKLMTPTFWNGLKFTVIFLLPEIASLLNFRFVPENIAKWFKNLIDQTVEYRTKNNVTRNDFMDLMIQLKSKPGEYEFTNDDIASHATSFFFDGFETSSLGITYTLYELAANVDVQNKLRKEIDSVLEKYEGKITYDAIQEMSHLDNVFFESLRKYPPALFLAKQCTEKYTLPPCKEDGTGQNLEIEAGTSIIIPLYGIHKDDKFYPDPEKFDPDRFTEENKQKRPKCTYLSFGEGPRICLGQRFAIAQSKMCVISLISKFEIRVSNKTKQPLKLDPTSFLTYMIGGIWLDVYKRGEAPK